MSILDLSKTFMFAFHYDKIVSKYGEHVKLLMTDTDSLVYYIETSDVYADTMADADAYDMSEYPPNHLAFTTTNKKVLGKMKDEYNGRIVKKFVGLRPKLYSILESDGTEKKKAKGINKCTTAKMRHISYLQALFEESIERVTIRQIRSSNHDLFSTEQVKVGLSPYDDKRYVLNDKLSTLAYGHYTISKI